MKKMRLQTVIIITLLLSNTINLAVSHPRPVRVRSSFLDIRTLPYLQVASRLQPRADTVRLCPTAGVGTLTVHTRPPPIHQQTRVIATAAEGFNLTCPELQELDPVLGVCVCSRQAASVCNSAQQLNPDTCQCYCVRVVSMNQQLCTRQRSAGREKPTTGDPANRKMLHARSDVGRTRRKMATKPSPQPKPRTMPPNTKTKPPAKRPPATKPPPAGPTPLSPPRLQPATPNPTTPQPLVPTQAPPTDLQCPVGLVLNLNSCQCYVPLV